MLRPGLTLDTARNEIGAVHEESQWIITADSSLPITCKEFLKVASKPHELGDTDVNNARSAVQKALKAGLFGPLNARNFFRFNNAYEGQSLRITDLVHDLVVDAIEHGSGFCTDGNVIVTNMDGEQGIALSVEQPNPGPDLEKVYREYSARANPDSFRYQDGFVGYRGFGTSHMVKKKTPWVWYEPLEKGGRTVMLETIQRLHDVFNR